MARIPAEEIERLKREVSLERLAEARGIRLQRHGADLLGLCPFHDDHEPSLVITPGKKPLALPRGLPGRGLGDRLGDARRGRLLPPPRGAPSPRPPAGGALEGQAAGALDGAEAPRAAGCERGRPGAAAPCGRLLPRELEGEPRGARLSRQARPAARRGGGALPARLREPDLGL